MIDEAVAMNNVMRLSGQLAPDAPEADFVIGTDDSWAASYAELERERDLAYGQLFRTTQDMRRLLAERDTALKALTRAHHQTLLKLAVAAEYKDGDTGTHIVRLGRLSELLAVACGMDAQYGRLLRLAAPMHDVGKIGIPDAILKKAGPLDADEWAVMREHPAIGARILGDTQIPLFALAAEVALGHHEKWDGSGYPGGLRGEEIAFSARIVAVVDFFDALTMDRVYRPRLPDHEALDMLRQQSGRHFDPEITAVFLAIAHEIIAERDRINADPSTLEAQLTDDLPT